MRFLVSLLSIWSVMAFAEVNIAVIDSGLDTKHTGLVDKIWLNLKEDPSTPRDDDGNDYPNDMNGWNFAENNNQLIDYVYSSVYENPDVFKFFEVQKRQFLMRATAADLAWLEEKRADKKFMSDLSLFGNFMHGTHVSGITTSLAKNPKVIGIKLLPTKSPLKAASLNDPNPDHVGRKWKGPKDPPDKTSGKRIDLIKTLLTQLAILNSQNLIPIGHYVAWTEAEVANGSFGIGPTQSKMIVGMLFKALFFRAGSDDELKPLIKHFLVEVNKGQKSFVTAAPDTLFVFAAGNDGSDNDIFPAAPASVGGDNVISVAASFGNVKIAKFSNFGKKSVDIAAPGVFINSTIPMNKYMEVSGTSQASPRVAAAAAQILEINSKLTPKEVKQILMGTVDYKPFLTEIVVSGGVLNQERAAYAASYARSSSSLEESIIVARTKVKDLMTLDPSLKGSSQSVTNDEAIVPIEMPTGFDLSTFSSL